MCMLMYSFMKKRINLLIDEELYLFAKKLGLNMSKFLNERLKELRIKTRTKL